MDSFLNQYKNKPINIKVEFEDINKNLISNMQNLGKNASTAFGKGFNFSNTSSYTQKITQEVNRAMNTIDKQLASYRNKIGQSQYTFDSLKNRVGNNQNLYGSVGYEKITSSIVKAEQALSNFNQEAAKGSNANLDKLNSDMKEFISLTNKANKDEKRLTEMFSSSKQNEFFKDLEKYRRKNSASEKDFAARYDSILSLKNTPLTIGQMEDVRSQVKNLKTDIELAGKSGMSLREELGRGFKKIGQFAYTYGAIQEFQQRIFGAVNELKEIDSVLTEISKTSDLTIKQIKELGKSSFDTASEFGKTAKDYLVGVQEMSRSGFYGDHAEELAKLSILGQAAGDMSADISNSYLLATNAAYDYKGNVEKLNAVLDGQNMININGHAI